MLTNKWGRSSVGRALHSHCRGRGFESPRLHHATSAQGEVWCPAKFRCSGTKKDYYMHYVYLIKSVSDTKQRYIGYSRDLKQRLRYHNAGRAKHTSKYIPWHLVTYIAFDSKVKARAFEKYLKSHSSIAFANKRFW